MRSYQSFAHNLTVRADTALVLLDELQDPHNVGAVIRSAAAFISGVLIPEHNQSQVSGAVVKVSAGFALFRCRLFPVGNVNTVIRDLKDRDFGCPRSSEGDAPDNITKKKNLTRRLCLSSNVNQGIRLKTRELCDVLLSILPIPL